MCPTSTASSACPTPRIGSITTSMSASHNCSPTFSPPPCQPRTECRPTHDRPPLGVVRQMAEVPGMSPWQRWTLVLVCTAVFMLLLDITVVSVALPSIQRDLRASLPDLQWVSAAYALVLAVLLLPAATLGDRLGRRRLFLVGLVIFTAGALTALMFALIRGNALGWASPAIVALFATAAVAFAGFVIYELRIAAAPMADLRLFARRSFAATGFVAFAISATVIGVIIYLSLYVQNTLGYSPVQAGLWFLPLSLASFAVALLTGRLIGKVAMRVLLGVAMVAAAAGLASMAHLTATSTWLVLLPGFILAGIGLGVTSTGLASAALSAVEPAHAGMAAGLVNTLRQVGTATGVAVLGALYASRVTAATLPALAGPPGAVHRLAAAVASGAGTG